MEHAAKEHPAEDFDPPTPRRVAIDVGTAAVPVDVTSLGSVVTWIMNNRRQKWEAVVTPNLHLLRQVRQSPWQSRLYSEAALSLPDGWPVAWLASRIGGLRVQRVQGADIFQELIEQPGEGRPLVLVGGDPSPKLDNLYDRCRRLGWSVYGEPAPREEIANPIARSALAVRVAQAGSGGVVVLGIGSPQKEELSDEISELPGRGAILCLGMSINFSAGVVHRAPRIIRSLRLEWLYRALSEPRRLFVRYVLDAAALPPLVLLNPKGRPNP